MIRKVLAVFLSFAAPYAHAKGDTSTPLRVVESVDLTRYSGTWYEIARLPNRFQDDCAGDITATYTLLEEGRLKVVNRCRKSDGSYSEAQGIARRGSDEGPAAKLEVRFAPAFLSFLPFVWGDYWIIELAEDYSHAVIGEPDRGYLWVLGRTPVMKEEVLAGILKRAMEQGYSLEPMIYTSHTVD